MWHLLDNSDPVLMENGRSKCLLGLSQQPISVCKPYLPIDLGANICLQDVLGGADASLCCLLYAADCV